MSSPQQPCRSFSLAEIQAATDNFDEKLVIGKGGFGKVFKGQINNEDVAIKRLFYTPDRDIMFKKEIETVSHIHHCRLVSLIGYCYEKDEFILVYEHMPNGSLHDHLHKDGNVTPLPWDIRLKICIGAADGLHYLHQGIGLSERIIHGDIKSANILLDTHFEAKIADFGLSTVAPANTGQSYVEHTTLKFSRDYVDPHYLATKKLTKESDVYSFGILLFELLCGKKAFDQEARHNLKQGRFDGIIDSSLEMEASEECLKDFINIAVKCLHKKPHKRPRMLVVMAALYKLDTSLVPIEGSPDSMADHMEFLEDNGRGYDVTVTRQLFYSRPILLMRRVNDFLFPYRRESLQIKDIQTTLTYTNHMEGSSSPGDGEKANNNNPGYGNLLFLKADNDNPDYENLLFLRDDIETFEMEDLSIASVEVLGKGVLGSTYKAILSSRKVMAVKWFRHMNNVGKEEFQEHMRRLGMLRHSNLLPLAACYYSKDKKLLITDYFHNDSLAAHLHGIHGHDQQSPDWPTRLNIVKGIATGLLYLYNELRNLIVPHGNLKSSNVLLNKSLQPLLTDYGLAPVVDQKSAQNLMIGVANKTDVWSLGILILEILTGKNPAHRILEGGGIKGLLTWVGFIIQAKQPVDRVFDVTMRKTKNSKGEMVKLLKIGLNCCEDTWDLKEVVEKIEEVREED